MDVSIELQNQLQRTLQEIFKTSLTKKTRSQVLEEVGYQFNFIKKSRRKQAAEDSDLPTYSMAKSRKGYRAYLSSPHWKRCRKLALERDDYICKHCGSSEQLQVHHLTYANKGNEHNHLDDLLTLCEPCHKKTHGL